jgi:hypothetical protein
MTKLDDLIDKRQRREELERRGKSGNEACEAVYGDEFLEFQALSEDDRTHLNIKSAMDLIREFPTEAPDPLMAVLRDSIVGDEVIDSIMPRIRECRRSALPS